MKKINKINKMSKSKKSIIFIVCLVLAVIVPLQFLNRRAAATCTSQTECQNLIATLQQQANAYQAEADRLNSEAQTLQNNLAKLNNEKAVLQAQIDVSQVKYDNLVLKIAETEGLIKSNQDSLGKTIADMYVGDEVTPIEMLAGSGSISEYLDKQEYRASVRNQLADTIAKVKTLKADLEKQKAEVDTVLADQKTQRAVLVAKQNEQQSILNATNGQEAEYQKMISGNISAIAEAKATQAALSARITGSGGYKLVDAGSLGDYPWNSTNCPMQWFFSTVGADGNGGDGHGYGCRQCASYVAWRFAKETGIYPSWGNAVDFTYGATSLGYPEGSPKKGSIAVMDPGKAGQSFGHVAWVESDPYVSGGRNVVLVSQYNYDFGWGFGYYSLMELSVNAFDHYINIK